MQFSGGRGHELAREIAPLVLVSGGARVVVVASELLLGKGLKVMVSHGYVMYTCCVLLVTLRVVRVSGRGLIGRWLHTGWEKHCGKCWIL